MTDESQRHERLWKVWGIKEQSRHFGSPHAMTRPGITPKDVSFLRESSPRCKNLFNLEHVLGKVCETFVDGVINDAEPENHGLIMIQFIVHTC